MASDQMTAIAWPQMPSLSDLLKIPVDPVYTCYAATESMLLYPLKRLGLCPCPWEPSPNRAVHTST